MAIIEDIIVPIISGSFVLIFIILILLGVGYVLYLLGLKKVISRKFLKVPTPSQSEIELIKKSIEEKKPLYRLLNDIPLLNANKRTMYVLKYKEMAKG